MFLGMLLVGCGNTFVPVDDGLWTAAAYQDHLGRTAGAGARAAYEAARAVELLDAALVLDGDLATLTVDGVDVAAEVERFAPAQWSRACPTRVGTPTRRPERLVLHVDPPLDIGELAFPVTRIAAESVGVCRGEHEPVLQFDALDDADDRFTLIELAPEG